MTRLDKHGRDVTNLPGLWDESDSVHLDEADKIQAEQKQFAEAEFKRLLLEKAIGREFQSDAARYLQWHTFWQGWWLGFLKNKGANNAV